MNNRMASLLLCLVVLLTLSARSALPDDEHVWAALKQGSKVILLRHTHVDIREAIGHLAPGNCAEEVNLSGQRRRAGRAHRRSFPRSRRCGWGGFDQPLLPLH